SPRILIFIVTSYPDYLDEALRENVFRFLSKPIDKERLFRNLKDAVYKYNMETKEIPLETEQGIELLKADEIVCVETIQRKSFLHTVDSVIQTNQSVEYWRKKLDLPCFYSSHRGIIINMRYVSKVGKDVILLKYRGKTKEVYLARRKYTEFRNLYLLYLESIK
ncbi:MAG: LytTR family transcriptional regulator DNA-binding domain-containing protein, partial [Clostridiales bacterium]|nr:LytTR family transcriptional regulator DNA-binding domain-containing protein [Clostridiales bacterium]